MLSNKELIDKYEEMGKRWVNGEIEVEEWQMGDKKFKLLPTQRAFINDRNRFTLCCGGFGSGKTMALMIKLTLFALWFPNNRILLGRKTRSDLEKVTLPDFFDICPPQLVEHKIQQGMLKFFNGSEIILFGLDALQSESEGDIKKAEQALKSLNLGAVFIDQLEETEERVWNALRGRVRRNVLFRQFNATTNPADFWAFDWFKANPRPNSSLHEVSTLENKANLPADYIQDLLNNPDSWVNRYVIGRWTKDAPSEKRVFSTEYIQEQDFHIQEPIREFDGIKIFKEPEARDYQIGVDPSEGNVDPCYISVVDKDSGEQVASFSGFVPITVVIQKVKDLSQMYSKLQRPLVVPESNSSGLALIEGIKEDCRVYERVQAGNREDKQTTKLGFNTDVRSKRLLIENFRELLKRKFPKLRDKKVNEEMRSFIYTDNARQKGAGATSGSHDDSIMGTMLSYWDLKPMTEKEKGLMERLSEQRKNKKIDYQFI